MIFLCYKVFNKHWSEVMADQEKNVNDIVERLVTAGKNLLNGVFDLAKVGFSKAKGAAEDYQNKAAEKTESGTDAADKVSPKGAEDTSSETPEAEEKSEEDSVDTEPVVEAEEKSEEDSVDTEPVVDAEEKSEEDSVDTEPVVDAEEKSEEDSSDSETEEVEKKDSDK